MNPIHPELAALFLAYYHEKANLLNWQPDATQQQTLIKIAALYQQHERQKNRSAIATLLKWQKIESTGIYLYGPVGHGKTVLMDIIAEGLPSSRKIRWHFTEFMQKIHQLNANFGQNKKKAQPIDQSIGYLEKYYDYLFIDELEVTEIADAMLLGRLFKGLSEAGVVVFVTSNIAPEHLYQGGLHYDRFYPFVSYLQSVFQIFNLNNDQEIDFRTFDKPFTNKSLTLENLKQLFDDIASLEGYHPAQFTVNQRLLKFTNATKSAVWLDFNEFGQQAYGAADYQMIAQNFAVVFLINVPEFKQENQNAARRFITFIDCLYDSQVKVYIQSAAPPDALFAIVGKNPLPFQRTVSRLIEMQGAQDRSV